MVYITIQLLAAVKCSMIYEWKERLYTNSLQVQAYICTNGRVPIPEYARDGYSIILKGFCHATSICKQTLFLNIAINLNL